jgi:hypothetical protein
VRGLCARACFFIVEFNSPNAPQRRKQHEHERETQCGDQAELETLVRFHHRFCARVQPHFLYTKATKNPKKISELKAS